MCQVAKHELQIGSAGFVQIVLGDKAAASVYLDVLLNPVNQYVRQV